MEITKEELLKLAKLSALTLNEDEIPSLIKQIQDVLNYAQSIKVLAEQEVSSRESIDTMRHVRTDHARLWDRQEILDQAPEHTEDFFVVPRIIEGH